MEHFISYLFILGGVIYFILAILNNHTLTKKTLQTKFIDKNKYLTSMNILFLVTGSIYIILGLLPIFKLLSTQLSTVFFSLYYYHINYYVEYKKKYGPLNKTKTKRKILLILHK